MDYVPLLFYKRLASQLSENHMLSYWDRLGAICLFAYSDLQHTYNSSQGHILKCAP